jgi:hypothetical protein
VIAANRRSNEGEVLAELVAAMRVDVPSTQCLLLYSYKRVY